MKISSNFYTLFSWPKQIVLPFKLSVCPSLTQATASYSQRLPLPRSCCLIFPYIFIVFFIVYHIFISLNNTLFNCTFKNFVQLYIMEFLLYHFIIYFYYSILSCWDQFTLFSVAVSHLFSAVYYSIMWIYADLLCDSQMMYICFFCYFCVVVGNNFTHIFCCKHGGLFEYVLLKIR